MHNYLTNLNKIKCMITKIKANNKPPIYYKNTYIKI